MTKTNVPRLRFSGFSDGYYINSLKEITDKIKSYSLSRDYEVSSSNTEYVHYGDIHTRVNSIINIDDKLPNIKDDDYVLLKGGDLILADASEDYNEVAKPLLLENIGNRNVVAGLHTIALRLKRVNPKYLFYFMQTDFYKRNCYKLANGMKVYGINYDNLGKIKIALSSFNEQKKIGDFFAKQDKLIELQTKKVDQLKKLKRGYLQKMFPQEGETVPRLRFSGFSGEWKEEKLDNLSERITRKNKDLESELPLTISAQFGLIDQETFFNKKVASKDLSNYFLIKRGEFAYNKSYSNGYPFGTIKSLKKYNMGVLSSLYIVFDIKKNNNHLFFDSFFDSSHWYKEISTKTTEGARNHGLLNISPQEFMNIRILFPYNISEQKKIGDFFAKLDKLIEEKSNKLDQLKQQKKAYLQKMFI